ncbi:ABC transporter ATP-binding protein [uncultured Thermomonospora sp.]|uniref:ABC transporter ATP-binding protein n=1 Tax=uncultured Thermomonospora sp. TaxID=671175 RepID=UPI00259BA7B2|nr:ABC transporter ATP-binding protein [uncultured Thermomonospora sp.]
MTVLEVRDLRVGFHGGRVPAVRGVDFSLKRGEVLGIVGESGCGKSATALALMGLLPPGTKIGGSVRLHGRELIGRTDAELAAVRGRDIAMIFQDPAAALSPVRPVGDQIAETIRVHQGLRRAAARARAVELLDLVGVPDPARRARAHPHELSGGMRQRVMIAMAVANRPSVIVADEPTTALDGLARARTLGVLQWARETTGAAVIVITHDLGVAAHLADRVLVMYAGRAVETGPVEAVCTRPRMPYTIGLLRSVPRLEETPSTAGPAGSRLVALEGAPPVPGHLPPGCPFAPRCPVAQPRCRRTEPEPRTVGEDGHRVACLQDIGDPGDLYPRPAAPFSGPPAARAPSGRTERPVVLEVRDLVSRHRLRSSGPLRRAETVPVLDGVSFTVRAGETLALVGESGAGKTTTLLEIARLRAPQGGRITVLGHDVAALTAARRKALRRRIQLVFQDPSSCLDPRMRVADVLAEPLSACGLPRRHAAARIEELLALVGLEAELAGRYPASLSGGQRQRVAIARALATDPRLLLLDEPVSALDASVQAGVLKLLQDLKARLGPACLLVAHDLAMVGHVADRVAVMYRGRILEAGEVGQVYRRPAHPYTRELLAAVLPPDPRGGRRRFPPPAPPEHEGRPPPAGCRFRIRCPRYAALDPARSRRCEQDDPGPLRVGPDQFAACHYPEAMPPWTTP